MKSVLALSLLGLGAVRALPAPAVEERQVFDIGNGGGTFEPGNGSLPPCITEVPIEEQPPCFMAPITGGMNPPRVKRFTLPPDYNTNTKKVIQQLELELQRLQNKRYKTEADQQEIKDIKAALKYLAGIVSISAPEGGSSTFTPGKRFTLPPDASTDKKKAIQYLELELQRLQNKRHKTEADQQEIKNIKAALKYLAGIVSISAPEGGSSTFTPGKRAVEAKRFTLPPDYNTNTKKVIQQLELELQRLQNKRYKTEADQQEIDAIKAALKYLAGIVSISAPEGGSSTFTPGKRDSVTLNSFGAYASQCPDVRGVELALKTLLSKGTPSLEEYRIIQKLAHYLAACGFAVSDDDTAIFKLPNRKRDEVPSYLLEQVPAFDVAGLQEGYTTLLEAAGDSLPPFNVWLILQDISDILTLHGVTAEGGSLAARALAQRQSDFTLGKEACSLTVIIALKSALAQFYSSYGDPRTAPANIFLLEQNIVTALQACGQTINGWTTLTPGNPIPGGPMVPDKTIPGGPMVPDYTVPGGAMNPDPAKPGGAITPDPTKPGGAMNPDKREETSSSDPSAILAALAILEENYGTYSSGGIPYSLYPTIVNIVTILQSYPDVTVGGWPALGQGTVSLYPSP